MMIQLVEISRSAERDLRRVPRHVVVKLMGWVAAVEDQGLKEVRRIPGYHDEPLKGDRAGQRSIRLSRSYRAFYVVRERPEEEQTIEFVSVEEVNKHDY
jgi:proteic killer suppression protein